MVIEAVVGLAGRVGESGEGDVVRVGVGRVDWFVPRRGIREVQRLNWRCDRR